MHYNPTDETTSVWRLLSPGTHARIATALDSDQAVQAAIEAKLQDPNNGTKRQALIDLITRHTGSGIGQAAAKKPLATGDSTLSIFKILQPGTEAGITEAIGGSADAHDALATKDRFVIVRKISRMAGNCIGQAAVGQGVNILGHLL